MESTGQAPTQNVTGASNDNVVLIYFNLLSFMKNYLTNHTESLSLNVTNVAWQPLWYGSLMTSYKISNGKSSYTTLPEFQKVTGKVHREDSS